MTGNGEITMGLGIRAYQFFRILLAAMFLCVPRAEPSDHCPTKLGAFSNAPSASEIVGHLSTLAEGKTSRIRIESNPQILDAEPLGPEAADLLRDLDELLVGNPKAKLFLAQVVQKARLGTRIPGKPVAVVLLLGITGAGKTLTAEALAEALTGNPKSMIVIHSGEMQQDHETSRLTGATAGYKGHGETENLVTPEKLRANTSSRFKVNVVLVDEIEKAGNGLKRLLLGIMDKAEMYNGKNERMDFSDSIIIMTGNLGQEEIQNELAREENPFGFSGAAMSGDRTADSMGADERLETIAKQAATRSLAPEFLNRIDQTFVYVSPTRADVERILDLNLAAAQRRCFFDGSRHKVIFALSPAARRHLVDIGYAPEHGGRSLRRIIDAQVITPLTNLIASEQAEDGDLIRVDFVPGRGGLSFDKLASQLLLEEQYSVYRKIYGPAVPEPKKGWDRTSGALAQAPRKIPHAGVRKFSSVNLRKTDFAELPKQLEGLTPTDKLNRLSAYLHRQVVMSDIEFLGLLEHLPRAVVWGFNHEGSLRSAMRSAGFGDWDARFEPLEARIIWAGLTKIGAVARPAEFEKCLADCLVRIDALGVLHKWTSGYIAKLKAFISSLHAKAIDPSQTFRVSENP